MTVYVESNFVLEIALGQRDASAANLILQSALQGEIVLAIPANALFEPFSTVNRRRDRRRSLMAEMDMEIRDLKRSEPHQHDVASLEPIPGMFAAIADREKDLLIAAVQQVIGIATVIGIDARMYSDAVALADTLAFPKTHDAIVLAAVQRHVAENDLPRPHYFATRDAADFAFPAVKASLEALGCTITYSFTECAQRLRLTHG